MGTQKDIAKKIIDKGADYILSLKENQKTLYNDVKLYIDDTGLSLLIVFVKIRMLLIIRIEGYNSQL